MSKRRHILECTKAYVIAEDIISPSDEVVMPKGTVINKTVFKKLVELGIEYILVDTEKNNDEKFQRETQTLKLKYE